MRKSLKAVIITVVAVFIFSSVAAFVDTLIATISKNYFIYSLFSGLNYYAVNTIMDLLVALAIALPLTVFGIMLKKLVFKRKGFELILFVISGSWAFLVYLLIFVFINVTLIRSFFSPFSLAINAGTLVLSIALWRVLYVVLGKFRKPLFGRNRALKVWIFAGLVNLAVVLGGFWLGPSGFTSNPEGYNVLIITIDALKQDYVSTYSGTYVRTPNLDNFAGKALKFENAYTNNPWTIPSMYTMNCSRYPSVHGAHSAFAGNSDLIMLAEVLTKNGYDTEAYVSNPIMRGEYGFEKGFLKYNWMFDVQPLISLKRATIYKFFLRVRFYLDYPDPSVNTTSWTTNVLTEALDTERRRPFFIWAHYLDPHSPLTPPERYIEGTPGEVSDLAALGSMEWLESIKHSPEHETEVRELYAAEVRYVDDSLERVFRVVEERGYYKNTLIIITADHGEELFEHGDYGHGADHYNEVMAIPMIIYFPEEEPGVSDKPVALIDIMPTVLDYLGIPVDVEMSGESLLEATVEGKPDVFFDRTCDDDNVRSLRRGDYTLVRTGDSHYEYQLLDNTITRGAQTDVTNEYPGIVSEYRNTLDGWAEKIAEEAEQIDTKPRHKADDIQIKNLKAFGYVD